MDVSGGTPAFTVLQRPEGERGGPEGAGRIVFELSGLGGSHTGGFQTWSWGQLAWEQQRVTSEELGRRPSLSRVIEARRGRHWLQNGPLAGDRRVQWAGPIEGEVRAFVVLQGRVCSGWNGVWWWRRAEEEEVYGRDEVQGVGPERRGGVMERISTAW